MKIVKIKNGNEFTDFQDAESSKIERFLGHQKRNAFLLNQRFSP